LAQLLIPTAILAFACSASGHADRMGRHHVPRHGIAGKVGYCTDCHGPSGRGYRGFYVMPRLAGQTPEYVENQLRAFADGRRESRSAMNMARVHGLGPAMRSALAEHFAELSPPPFGRAPRRHIETGRQIYEVGLPNANVPACSVCHGADAKGHGSIPRLAGQLYAYTVKELSNWDSKRGQGAGTSRVMRPVAHSLSKSQIAAVAAYLSYLD
jgi:cytochrome c553